MTVGNEIKVALSDIDAGKVLYNEKMSTHTSLKVGGSTDALIWIENENQLIAIVKRLREKNIKFFTAGNLTNIIVRDGGYRGAILLMTGMNDIRCEQTSESRYRVSAMAGVSLSKVVHHALTQELTGLEFCAGIPGSVGGAVWMNAGAYGKEMKDVIQEVTILDASSIKRTMRRDEISFSYRHSDFPDATIILSAQFHLEKGERSKIRDRISEIMRWRQEKHPLEYPSAGSVFKNLPGMPAGKLIEEMGLKGTTVGGAQISTKHANFIINRGGATATDILSLIDLIQSKARQDKGITLETEVVIIGEK
ncbi:MAG: UDP-N-acetylmuramate dehydrogenase [Smithella sp.]|nr:UDP-N-acetylmuramate dehydrogenase [Smithella sp.]